MRQAITIRKTGRRSAFRLPPSAFAAAGVRRARPGFTLVELLVVITIIAILAGLLIAAAAGAIGAGNQARIVATMTQLDTAMEDYKNNVGSYPPNAQTNPRNGVFDYLEPGHAKTLQAFKRHFKKAFPSHRESDELLAAIVGLDRTGVAPSSPNPGEVLIGGMNAAEALVFWLGGFSQDAKYPISGPGGPSYSENSSSIPPAQGDPVENRGISSVASIQNLGPRNASNYFDDTDGRFIVYNDPRSPNIKRRLNFWYLKAPGSPAPYLYFDASRGSSATAENDPPASTVTSFSGGQEATQLNELPFVHAIKALKSDTTAREPFQFANNNKYQLLHPGVDEDWATLPRVDETDPTVLLPAAAQLLYPTGPWTLELEDTLTNFADGTLGDAQE